MVAVYVDGQKVGTLADAERLLPELAARGKSAELRDEATGRRVATVTPDPESLVPWDPTITKEELDRRAAGPGGMTLAEFWKQMGVA
jgi:hypothetical protein